MTTFLKENSFVFDSDIYSEKALNKSISTYRKYLNAKVIKKDQKCRVVMVEIKKRFERKEEEIKGEFLNYVLGSSIYLRNQLIE